MVSSPSTPIPQILYLILPLGMRMMMIMRAAQDVVVAYRTGTVATRGAITNLSMLPPLLTMTRTNVLMRNDNIQIKMLGGRRQIMLKAG